MKLAKTIIIAATTLGMAGTAQAMPAASTPAIGSDAAPLFYAREGCGFGAHRGFYGGCRLNRGPRGAIRQAITGAPGGCPPGLYRGPRGGCRR